MALAAFLLLAACSPWQGTSPPSTSASSHTVRLVAVARADADRHAVASIVTDAGVVVASASFDLAPFPMIGPAADLIQPPVRVAAGAVFYADAHGVVRRLDRDGRVTPVATFPLTSAQQELAFAVSPDGGQLMASILSAPPLVPEPNPYSGPFFVPGATWTLELFTATAGAAVTSTFRRDLGTQFPRPTVVVGWDQAGPLATLNTNLGTQQRPLSELFTGDLIHLAPDGTHADQVGGADCMPLDELLDGTVLCQVGSPLRVGSRFEVRRSSGELLWQQDQGQSLYEGARLSPDGRHIASDDTVFTRTAQPASGTRLAATSGTQTMYAQGWLDSTTIVAGPRMVSLTRLFSGSPLFLVDVSDTSRLRALGVSGAFEGVL